LSKTHPVKKDAEHLLSVLFDLLPVKAKKDATAGERGLNYAMSTIMALLVVGSVVQIYLLLFM
jgi:hypothetical protein